MERESDRLHAELLEASKQLSTETVMFHHAAAARLGLHITDHKCLEFVLSRGKATAGQLAQWSGLTTGAITGVLNRLEKAGYIKRVKDPSDLRVVCAVPLPERLGALGEIFGPLGAAMGELYGRYSARELEAMLDYMTRARRILQGQAAQLRAADAGADPEARR
ncbi:MarR family transcriptional regulator [Paenibacillus sp. IB182496]|uniref:MarR family transcriptional regulator n=1 Tax=Paenibacillus sabuli TaxID=2772509 RepID=A0A927BVY6_9BACL|nr:MarR family transcriptional regulator [Paenibacillus sabuli]MBD2846640.1 MarR family transcriptional regulator [Paenibacillus sabuli]